MSNHKLTRPKPFLDGRTYTKSAFIWPILLCIGTWGAEAESNFDLLLAGGGLSTCSSMAQHHCVEPLPDFADAKTDLLYRVDNQAIARLRRQLSALPLGPDEKLLLNSLDTLAKSSGQAPLTRRQLSQQIEATAGKNLLKTLADPLYYILLDSLEVRQLNAVGQAKIERVSLATTKTPHGTGIFSAFVEEARKRMPQGAAKPRIGVVTASARDPFEVADFYLQVFEQAGADVIWLPIDASFQQARAEQIQGFKGCQRLPEIRAQHLSFYRERIYPKRTQRQRKMCAAPKLLHAELASVQGIFFNGGDQSLTLASLKTPTGNDSPEMSLIRQRLAQGELVIGGTSAGTAFQAGGVANNRPVPMITNGHSELAMARGAFATPAPSQRCEGVCNPGIQADDLTYRANGGAGFFPLGILDTHFSERDRELRLAVFAMSTAQPYGFGVDEATALLVALPKAADGESQVAQFEVIGAEGVFVFDASQGSSRESSAAGKRQISIDAKAHYWVSGDKVALKNGQFQRLKTAPPLAKPMPVVGQDAGQWRNNMRQHCGSTEPWQFDLLGAKVEIIPNADSAFFVSETGQHCGYQNLSIALSHERENHQK